MHTEKRAEFRRGRIEKWEPPEGQREVGRRAAQMNPNSKHRVMLIALLDKTHRTVLGMTGPDTLLTRYAYKTRSGNNGMRRRARVRDARDDEAAGL
jgi:hypothetical protein